GSPGNLSLSFVQPSSTYQLDALSVAGKTALRGAYALTRLSSTYTGPTIKIRRGSDGVVSDFYADAGGMLGTGLNGTGTSFSSWIGGQLRYPPSGMTADSTVISGQAYGNGTYVSSASSVYSATNAAYRVFDNSIYGTAYASGNPTYDSVSGLYINSVTTIVDGVTYYGEWLQIQIPAAIVLTNYTIYGVPNTNSLHVRDLILCASNDGSTWTFVDQKSQLVWPYADPTFRNFSVTRPLIKPYTYYRFICRAITSGTY